MMAERVTVRSRLRRDGSRTVILAHGGRRQIIQHSHRFALTILASCFLATAGVQAQQYPQSFSGLLGVGGALDETDAGYGNPNWQLGFSNEIAEKTRFAARLGGLHWSSDDLVGDLAGPTLLYVTVAGEYAETTGSFSGSFVSPGIYLGLGFYHLDGENAEGESVSDSGPGLVIGLTGDINLNQKRSLTLRIEFAAHYAALDAAQIFGVAQIGVAYHF